MNGSNDASSNDGEDRSQVIHELLLHKSSTQLPNLSDEHNCDDQDADESDRYEIEQGENWLRLFQTEGRSVLDNTQDRSQTQSQESSVYPSIVSLVQVGFLDAPTNDCYICMDVDNTVLAVKDMRHAKLTDDEELEHGVVPCSALGIARGNPAGANLQWEALPRRQLRVLRPGDRICTSFDEDKGPIASGIVLEYRRVYKDSAKTRGSNIHVKNKVRNETKRMLQVETPSSSVATQPPENETIEDTNDGEKTDSLKANKSTERQTDTNQMQVDDDDDDDSDKTVDYDENRTESVCALGNPPIFLATQPNDDSSDEEVALNELKVQSKGNDNEGEFENDSKDDKATHDNHCNKNSAVSEQISMSKGEESSSKESKEVIVDDDHLRSRVRTFTTKPIGESISTKENEVKLVEGNDGNCDDGQTNVLTKDKKETLDSSLKSAVEGENSSRDNTTEKVSEVTDECLSDAQKTDVATRTRSNGSQVESLEQVVKSSPLEDGSSRELYSQQTIQSMQFSPTLCGSTEDAPARPQDMEIAADDSKALPQKEKKQEKETYKHSIPESTPADTHPQLQEDCVTKEDHADVSKKVVKNEEAPSDHAGCTETVGDNGDDSSTDVSEVLLCNKEKATPVTEQGVQNPTGVPAKIAPNKNAVSKSMTNLPAPDDACKAETRDRKRRSPPPRTSRISKGESELGFKKESSNVEMAPSASTRDRASSKAKDPKKRSSQSEFDLSRSRKRTRLSPSVEPVVEPVLVAEVRVITTGITLSRAEKEKVNRIGGIMLEDINDAASATHIIVGQSTSLRRTSKLMIGLCRTGNIVGLDWLLESAKELRALPAEPFLILDDKEAEAQYGFTMRETLKRSNAMRARGKALFDGYYFLLCPGVAGKKSNNNRTPPAKEFRLIIEAAGGSWISSFSNLKKMGSDLANVLLVASKIGSEAKKQLSTKLSKEATKSGARAITTEQLFSGIMKQEFPCS